MRGLARQQMRGSARHPEMRVVVRVMQVQEKALSTSREWDPMKGLSPRKSREKVLGKWWCEPEIWR